MTYAKAAGREFTLSPVRRASNPGAGLFTIAEKERLYKKHGLDVEIIKTNTTAVVQAKLAGKMDISTGVGAAPFVTAQLEGSAPGFSLSARPRFLGIKIQIDRSCMCSPRHTTDLRRTD